jgi:hypothetical protein
MQSRQRFAASELKNRQIIEVISTFFYSFKSLNQSIEARIEIYFSIKIDYKAIYKYSEKLQM